MSAHDHAFTSFNPRVREGLELASRRNFLKASLAGIAGLSLPGLLRHQADAAQSGRSSSKGKSVIRGGVGVNAHVGEIPAEARFEKIARRAIERPAGR